MKLALRYYGDPILRKVCSEVKVVNEEIRQIALAMIELMDSIDNAVGLAANQVGILHRIFVIRPEIQMPNGQFALGPPEVYINPVLSNPSQETEVMVEGCLSFPHLHAEVERPVSIHVEALDINGKPFSQDLYGFKAKEVMHENDHLNGKVFVDRVSKEKRKLLEPALKEIKKKYHKKF